VMSRHVCFAFLCTAIIAYSACGCASRDDSVEQVGQAGPKLTAFRKVVAKYKQSPGEFASEQERYRYNEELGELQSAFRRLPFEVSQNRKEAEAIVRMWQSDLAGCGKNRLHSRREGAKLRPWSSRC
jgi:hypothetical protein